MSLPIIDSFAYTVILPSTKQPIRIRPFLVKEEKLLLLSQESNNPDQQIDAIGQIIKNCTFNAIDPRVAPYFDVEYLLLQIRSKSVGEVVNPTYKCRNIIGETNTECGKLTSVSINISEIPPTNVDKDPSEFLIKLNPQYTLKLRYPTIYTVNELMTTTLSDGIPTATNVINGLIGMFESLLDTVNNTTYNFDDYSIADKIEFLDRLTPNDYKKVIKFLEDMPIVRHSTSFVCPNCNSKHEILLEGFSDFLA